MEMCGEESAGSFEEEMEKNGLGKGGTISVGGTATDFVKDDQGVSGTFAAEDAGVIHFDGEGAFTSGRGIGGGHVHEEGIDGSHGSGRTGCEESAMDEQGDGDDGAHLGRFSAHVGTGEDGELLERECIEGSLLSRHPIGPKVLEME